MGRVVGGPCRPPGGGTTRPHVNQPNQVTAGGACHSRRRVLQYAGTCSCKHRLRPKSRECGNQSSWIVFLHIVPGVGYGNPLAVGEASCEARGGLVGEDLASTATNHEAGTYNSLGRRALRSSLQIGRAHV